MGKQKIGMAKEIFGMGKQKSDISLELARRLSGMVNESFERGDMMLKVTQTTRELLSFWFCEPYTQTREINFHQGQRQAILNVIYLHEVLKINSVFEIYNQVAPDLLPIVDILSLKKEKYSFAKYCVKMATGTGKTWVMHALMIWQYLNARHEDTHSGRYTKNFLVVAPGLIVYDRLLGAYSDDFNKYQELFLPPSYKETLLSFVQNNVVKKEEIGKRVTGEGMIIVTNWHLFLKEGEDEKDGESEDKDLIRDLLPSRPGLSAGNSLEQLDRQYLRGSEMDYLSSLTSLMVINDEAHHIHEDNKEGEEEEVQWQVGLNYIMQNKTKGFFQLDFSATPYNVRGSGKNKSKNFFPYIVVDFDLSNAIRKGLGKSLMIDKRQELTEIENLDYMAVRGGKEDVSLSHGQRLMLKAGLEKLRILEESFTKLDEKKRPKMLVICEDTAVTPFVEDYFITMGLNNDDVLRVDSNRQGEIKKEEWKELKEKLFDIDNHQKPKIIISVLMLREGFDVNNICVVVPLRASTAPILLEQTIGRGLRIMFRDVCYKEEKEENRKRIFINKTNPLSYLDMLFIIEHPAFIGFYDELLREGLASIEEQELTSQNTIGDLIKVELKEDYKDYDLYFPIVIKDKEEEITIKEIDINTFEVFNLFTLDELRMFIVTKGETFISQEQIVKTTFGQYMVDANLFTAQSYNEYLQKILRIITNRKASTDKRNKDKLPMLQINEVEIIRLLDKYIKERLFSQSFDPFDNYDWKILLVQNGIVTQHIIKQMSKAIIEMQTNVDVTEAIIEKRWFSEVDTLRIRESYSLEVVKTIFPKLGYPSNKGGFERAFIEFLERDAQVQSYIKINETQHRFAHIFYIREDGLLANYSADFLVRTDDNYYIVETKGQDRIGDRNVRQKQLAMLCWCEKINLVENTDDVRKWEYVLLSENSFYSLSGNGATFSDICRLNKVSESAIKGVLF